MTKQKKLLQNCIKGFLSLVVLSLFAVITSCNNDDDDKVSISHKIVYKAEVSAGSNITSTGYYIGNDNITNVQGVSGTTWVSSENNRTIGVPKGSTSSQTAFAQVTATGANATSTLKVQIYVDGALVKEVTSTGTDLKAEAKYEVPYSAQ